MVDTRVRWVAVAVALAGAPGCSRPGQKSPGPEAAAQPDPVAGPQSPPEVPPSAATEAPATAPPAAGDFPPRDRATPVAPRPGEAERTTVTGFSSDPLLRAHLKTLRDHFGADARGPFDVQRASLVGGTTGLLVSGPHEADPIVLVVDRDRLLFVKPRPTAGILAPVRHVTIAPLHIGGVVLFGFVETLGTVAARMWADDGNPFGEFEVLASDRCDALSAAYSAGFGWVVVCATPYGARGARMTDDITMPWGHRGVPLGAPAAVGPVTVAFDSPGSFVLLERADSTRGERVLGYRFDGRGMELWAGPVPLDGLGRAASEDERIRAESLEKGGIRVEPLRGGGARGLAFEVMPDGKLSLAH